MRRSWLVVFTLAIVAGTSQAGVIGMWDSGTSVTDGTFSGTRYTLTLTSDGNAITAIDMKIVADANSKFYNEQFREGRIFEAGPATSYDVDTLFLFPTTNLAIATQGEHDVTPADATQRFTSDLYAGFAFQNGIGAFVSAPVAQVIVPAGSPAPTLANLRNTTDGSSVAYVVVDGLPVPVPEPGALALLAFGGLSLLRRRR
jgi:hypothetical protein